MLRSVTIPWDNILASSLTSLFLENIKDNALSARIIMAILHASPRLQELVLSSIQGGSEPGPTNDQLPDQRVVLTHLRHLKVWHIPVRLLHAILVHVIVPDPACHFSIRMAPTSGPFKCCEASDPQDWVPALLRSQLTHTARAEPQNHWEQTQVIFIRESGCRSIVVSFCAARAGRPIPVMEWIVGLLQSHPKIIPLTVTLSQAIGPEETKARLDFGYPLDAVILDTVPLTAVSAAVDWIGVQLSGTLQSAHKVRQLEIRNVWLSSDDLANRLTAPDAAIRPSNLESPVLRGPNYFSSEGLARLRQVVGSLTVKR